MKKTAIIYLLLLVTLSGAFARQTQRLLTGTVRSAKGEPLTGASILIRNTTSGTTADVDGSFSLPLGDELRSAVLVVSFIGYITQEVAVGDRDVINIILEEDATNLGEVIVTGYAVQERGKITGAVTTISENLISALPVPGMDQALQGRAAGVAVTQNTGAPGEGVTVRIRGAGSINSNNNPLYVVDGIPTLDINSVSTQDIASITVLKDAGATAVYGSRAANGVVIVTTKAGGGSAPRINFSTQVGVQAPSRRIPMTNTAEYVALYNEAATNDNAAKNPLLHRPLITEDIRSTLANVDYVNAILRDGILQTHNISISGGEGKTRYFLSANYFDQEGIIRGSDYSRLSSRANVDAEIKDWLKAGVNLNITRATTNLIGSSGDGAGGNGGSVIRYAFFRTPAIPIYDAEGEFTDKPERYDLLGDGYSPVGMLAYNNNEKISDRLFGKAFIDISILRDLRFTSNIGIDFTSSNQRRFDRNWGTGNRINNPNQLTVSDGRYQALTFSNFATWSRAFDNHAIVFLLGTEAIKVAGYELLASEKSFPDQSADLVYLGNGLGQRTTRESTGGNALLSHFGRISYDFREKYLVTATLRRDGSSRFGRDNRWGTFYAGSVGWRIDKEAFFLNSNTVDRLLLRASYGSIGNQEIGDYAFTDMIGAGYNYPIGNTKATGYAVSSLGNSKVKWETSNQLNVGVDLALWNGKFSGSLDYFTKITSDLLVRQPIASSAGEAQSPWVNNGKVLNRGIEMALIYSNTVGELTYAIAANGATLYNEVLEVNAPIAGGAIGSDRITRTTAGYPVGSFYLYEMEGIFQSPTDIFTHAFQGNAIQPGDVKFRDQNADGVIDGKDRKHVGSAIPKVTAGFNLQLGYRRVDLSVFFQGAYRQKIFSVLNRDIEGFYRPFNVTQRYYENHWTGPGTSDEFPRASWDASGNNTKYSTRFLQDGSYTRLKNIQIGYSIPQTSGGKLGFSAMRIYLSGTNLLTLSNYHGLDPEMTVSDNARGQGDSSAGLDWGTYPAAKSYNLGINLTF